MENFDSLLDDLFDCDPVDIFDGDFDYGDYMLMENMGAFDYPDNFHCIGCKKTGITKTGKICGCCYGDKISAKVMEKERQRVIEEKARRKRVTYWDNVPGAEMFRGISR